MGFESSRRRRSRNSSSSGNRGPATSPRAGISAGSPAPAHPSITDAGRQASTWLLLVDLAQATRRPVASVHRRRRRRARARPVRARLHTHPVWRTVCGQRRQGGGDGEPCCSGSRFQCADRVEGTGRAFAQSRDDPSSRLHRPGFAPIVGADAIARWLDGHSAALRRRTRPPKPRSPGTSATATGRSRSQRRRRGGRLRPTVEPRRVGPVVADGRRRAAARP